MTDSATPAPVSEPRDELGHNAAFYREGAKAASVFALAFTLLGAGMYGYQEIKERAAGPSFNDAAIVEQSKEATEAKMQKGAALLIAGLGLLGVGGIGAGSNYVRARRLEAQAEQGPSQNFRPS